MSTHSLSLKQDFERDGFVLVKNFFSPDRIKNVLSWIEDQDLSDTASTWTEKEPGVSLAVWPWVNRQDSPLADLVKDSSVLDFASSLIEKEVYLWASKVNFKAPWCGTVEYYHQDLVYWRDRGYDSGDMLSCMTFLDPHKLENGALHVIPGSHKKGLIEHQMFSNINGLAKMMVPPDTLAELADELSLVHIDAEPGDALFFHSLLIHGSAHNISSGSRRIALTQINSATNKPEGVQTKAKEFNLKRAQFELREAKRRYEWFQKKYDDQYASDEILFSAPIPDEEKD